MSLRSYASRALAGAGIAILIPFSVNGQGNPRREQFGEVDFRVDCAAAARPRFDRAVALLHHMTYSQARAEFSRIATDFPDCAMAHWGVAMTLFQPLWPTRPGADDLKEGWRAVSKAREIGIRTERERLLIDATAAFFEPGVTDYWQRIAGWAEGMRAAHEAFPQDIETTAFYALTRLATAPATGGLDHNVEAAALLDDILRSHPDHPGAVHYTIHANDASGRQAISQDVVRRYGAIAPRNPHALHMPTHIYARLGDWSGVIAGNRDAASAALENPAGERGQWVWDEFPHAIEYMVYAHLQVGDDSAALREMRRLQQTASLQPTFKTAFHLSSIPARYALERRDWGLAARLEPRPDPTLAWDNFPWPEAVTWFARGMGAIRGGDVRAARDAEARLSRLREASERLGEGLFARQTEILRFGLAAWLAHADARDDDAIRLMEEAVRLEAATPKPPVTPAPTLPATELLGDLLLDMDRPQAALQSYRSALEANPRRFNSIVGAARAAARLGDAKLATKYYRELQQLAVSHSPRPELAEAIRFLDRGSHLVLEPHAGRIQ